MYDSYLLYIKSKCPFCIKAIHRLKEEAKQYKTVTVDECDDEFIFELKEAYGHKSFPMVLGYTATSRSYSWIGGCDDLMTHLDNPKKF